uniref:Integrase catalytic domain-containing protein n=1 Tax=Anopheles stephensi TaxID=30069 RepID=A0A182YLF6_ANOST
MANDCIYAKANPPKISFHFWEQPTEPFQRIHVHYAGPFMGFYYLILADAYSKWPSEYVVKNMTTEITIRLCREFFSAYGLPSSAAINALLKRNKAYLVALFENTHL